MKKELFDELLESVKQGAAIMKGKMKPSCRVEFPESKVQKIREQYGLSQDKFAALMGISVATLRNWEQGRRKPEGAARVLLRVACRSSRSNTGYNKASKNKKAGITRLSNRLGISCRVFLIFHVSPAAHGRS